jgi:hypothetical protein
MIIMKKLLIFLFACIVSSYCYIVLFHGTSVSILKIMKVKEICFPFSFASHVVLECHALPVLAVQEEYSASNLDDADKHSSDQSVILLPGFGC